MEESLETLRGAQSASSANRMLTVYEPTSSPLNGYEVTESSSVRHANVQEELNAKNQR